MICHLDYETFSAVDLRAAGLWRYAAHASTEILCVAWAFDGGEPELWHPGMGGRPLSLLRAFSNGMHLHAFNANFEADITCNVGRRMGWPVPKDPQWVDTQALARMCALPGSLARVAEALKVPMQKDKDGARLIQLFCKPNRQGKRVLPAHQPEEFRRLCSYCKQDVRTDRSVADALPIKALPPLERKVWVVDRIINTRGVLIDREMAEGAYAMREEARVRACAKLPTITGGTVKTLNQSKKILEFAASKGCPLPNLKKETVAALLDHAEGVPPALRTLLELRSDTNMTSAAKYAKILQAAGDDDRVRGVHAYCAADTGRWGGRIVQFQNIPRPAHKLDAQDHQLIRNGDIDLLELLHGNVMAVLRDALRNTIRAPSGKVLHVVDKAAIEARVLGYLSDCKGYLAAFRNKEDLYIVTAMAIFGKDKAFFAKDKDCNFVNHDADFMRWVGKTVVLGLGYSMGEDTFYESCKKNGRDLPRDLVTRAVRVYRSTYKEIPAYWATVEEACKRAIRTRAPQPLPHGVVASMVGTYLTIALPSGRSLWYPCARLIEETTKWGKQKTTIAFMQELGTAWLPVGRTYGGKLVQNIVQAFARDLLAEALLKCEAAKLGPVLHIHDEVACEVEPSAHSIDEIHTIFRTAPPWAPGLLLHSGGFTSPFYKK